MKFMLDTDICIHLIKHRPQQLINRFERATVGDIGISSITLAELEYGAAKSSRPDRNRAALREFVSPLEVAAFTEVGTTPYGRIRALLERRGESIGSMDLLIAAHALSLGLPLITDNVAEFKRVPGLRVENWLR
jgi:tRNA(fMet)-specific endonuclease VapC